MTKELYFSYSKEAILKSPRGGSRVIGDDDGELMKKSIITADFEKKELVPPASLSRYALQKQRKVCLSVHMSVASGEGREGGWELPISFPLLPRR